MRVDKERLRRIGRKTFIGGVLTVSAVLPFLQNSHQLESSKDQTPPLTPIGTPLTDNPLDRNLSLQITQPEAEDATARVAKPELERKSLRLNIIPETLLIPSLGINNVEIIRSYIKKVIQPDGSIKLIPDVPNTGVATTNYDRLSNRINKISVFGHSAWKDTRGVLGKLENINLGDTVTIKATIPSRQKTYDQLDFVVDKILLADIESGRTFLLNETPDLPIIIIQTTVRENGLTEAGVVKKWILDKDKIKGNTESIIEGDENDPEKYLLLFVIGKLTPESLEQIRGAQ